MGKERKRSIRIDDDLDRKILRFSELYFGNNYSRCLRFLIEAGILIVNRLNNDSIKLLLRNDENGADSTC